MPSTDNESRMSAADARERFAEVVNRAAYGKERIIVSRRGKPVAAVVPMDDLLLLLGLEERGDIEAVREAEAEAVREGTVAWETVKRECGL
ncbi:type II toxin-antitoxin system Phd/YefM family antitoxin [Solidesulfovibrio sp. C21]|uniref:type II toxin-antitoxin system Phd/YefM family antitoxin n=1 Tax=Solidesulfovibrio sp. C21 TaxID=3398613 RepID=UPI0039FC16A1